MTAPTFFAIVCVAGIGLGGCTTLSPDGGVGRVRELAGERDPHLRAAWTEADDAATRARTDALLAQPLTVEAAIEVALRNNAGFRARVAELAVADAERAQAGRLANPVFSFSSKRSAEARSIERALMINLLNLATLPLNAKLAGRRFEDAQLRLAGEAVALAAETRRAWVRAVAAGEQLTYAELAHEAASAGSELAARMRAVGNFNQLARLRERAFAADTAANLARARNAALAEREQLTRTLGLWGTGASFSIPPALPDPPAVIESPIDAEQIAMERRLDVLAARRATEVAAEALDLTRAVRFVNVLHAGYANESERGEPRMNGYEVEVELPLFDFGDAKLGRSEAAYVAAFERARETAINARSDVRERYAAYRTAHELARHYRDEVVPLRKAIADEMLLRYNGMLIGIFDLLADARDQVASVGLAIAAKREFWVAQSHFQQALSGGMASGGALAAPAAATASGGSGAH